MDLGLHSLVIQEEQSIQYLSDVIDPNNNANYLDHLLHKGVELDTTNLATTSIAAAEVIHQGANFVGSKLAAHQAMHDAQQDFTAAAGQPANWVAYSHLHPH